MPGIVPSTWHAPRPGHDGKDGHRRCHFPPEPGFSVSTAIISLAPVRSFSTSATLFPRACHCAPSFVVIVTILEDRSLNQEMMTPARAGTEHWGISTTCPVLVSTPGRGRVYSTRATSSAPTNVAEPIPSTVMIIKTQQLTSGTLQGGNPEPGSIFLRSASSGPPPNCLQ